MPVYEFQCKCGNRFEALEGTSALFSRCEQCGVLAEKKFTPTKGKLHVWNPNSDPEFDDVRRHHQEWVESPETQAKMASGELVRTE